MQQSTPISAWLVLGPIFNPAHQSDNHFIGDGHPLAATIILDIDNNPLEPKVLTGSLAKAPKASDRASYGNGKFFEFNTYTWRSLRFTANWENIHDIEDDIHQRLLPESFDGKHHCLAFFLVYIRSPDYRRTKLCIRSDDSIRVWLNGHESEALRFVGERDINEYTVESCAEIMLCKGWNILLAAVAETHVEWGFSARIENDTDLHITPEKPSLPRRSLYSCGVIPTERNRYFTGKYMTARDFAGEQEYFLGRQRLHNRLLHGWGILCGLAVTEHRREECRKNWVEVKAGIALDCCGREIFLTKDTAIEVPVADLSGAPSGALQETGDVHSQPLTGLLLCIHYAEQEIEPVPVLYAEGHCDPQQQETNRIREVAALEWRRLDEMPPGCWRLPYDSWDALCCDDGDWPSPGPAGVCLEPDCACDEYVPLALLHPKLTVVAGNEPLFTIDTQGRRQLPIPARYLTRIVNINWPHDGEVSLNTLRQEMQGRLEICFNRRIKPEYIDSNTFIVQYTGIQRSLEFLPSNEERKWVEEDYRAVFTIDEDYISSRREGNIVGYTLYITLKCDFILDCHELPVDGNHLGGRLPSGNGVPGSDFFSWFRVVQ
jgi:hypothetical protein